MFSLAIGLLYRVNDIVIRGGSRISRGHQPQSGMRQPIITARKRSLRRLCFYKCLSVHTGGACMRGFIRGVCGFIRGGMHVVLFGGVWFYVWFYSWFYLGGMHVVLFRGVCAWFYSGGMHGFIWGGVRGFLSFFGYNEIRSMSGRYASYWNAFLFCIFFCRKLHENERIWSRLWVPVPIDTNLDLLLDTGLC